MKTHSTVRCGGPIYPISVHLRGNFRNLVNEGERNCNKVMSKVLNEVELIFDDLKNFFRFIEFKKQLKVGISAAGKYFLARGVLQNTSEYFRLNPPTQLTNCF